MEWRLVNDTTWVLITREGQIVGRVTPSKTQDGFWARALTPVNDDLPAGEWKALGTYIDIDTAKRRVEREFPNEQIVRAAELIQRGFVEQGVAAIENAVRGAQE